MKVLSSGLKHAEVTGRILHAYDDVYNDLGPGFLESVYEQSMLIALREAGLDVQTQVRIPVCFRGNLVGNFSCDMMVNGSVLLELKAAKALDGTHQAQLTHYLKATDVEVGLILNFGGPHPEFKRIVLENKRKDPRNPRRSGVDV